MKSIFSLFILVFVFCSSLLASPSGLKLAPMQGGTLTLTKGTHPVTLVVFWATWCPPCLQEIPSFLSLYEKYQSKGLQIIGISLDENRNVLAQFLKDTGLPYPVVMNTKQISKAFPEVTAVPTLFILDKNLDVVLQVEGLHSEAFIERHIAPLLGVTPPSPVTTTTTLLKKQVKSFWARLRHAF